MGFLAGCSSCPWFLRVSETLFLSRWAKTCARLHCRDTGHTTMLLDGDTILMYRKDRGWVHVERVRRAGEA